MVGLAETVLLQALGSLAQRMGLDGARAAARQLRQGDHSAWGDFHYDLASDLAQQLGALSQDVKAAYVDEYEAVGEDLFFGEAARTTVISLIVWVQRKTDTFNSIVSALDRALVQKYMDLIGTPRLTRLLEVQVIDDDDAKNPTGYGRWLAPNYFPLTELWSRPGANLELH
jgi:hypothetical protein